MKQCKILNEIFFIWIRTDIKFDQSLLCTLTGKLDQKELASIYKTLISSKKKDPHHCLETFWKVIYISRYSYISVYQ